MNRSSLLRGLLPIAVFLTQVEAVGAEEVKVLSTIGVRSIMQDLGPQFERTANHKLHLDFDVANSLKRRIAAGEKFDVAILTVPVMDDLINDGVITSESRVVVARGGMGVAGRAGAPKPDISSTEGFKRALLDAKSIAYAKEGFTGMHFTKIQQQLGIAAEIGPKAKLTGSELPPDLVARGEAELAVHIIPELLANKGVQLIGPFPPDLQTFVVLPGGVSRNAAAPNAAKELLEFLTGPKAAPLFKEKGYEQG